jgi:hypothetical protein
MSSQALMEPIAGIAVVSDLGQPSNIKKFGAIIIKAIL